MNLLAVIHGEKVRAGIFGDSIAERGDTLEEWSLAWGSPPPRPLDDYDAVLVFGGAMHDDQEEHHPWLRDENFLLQRLLGLQMPILGVCLGAQLLARAAHAEVGPCARPEIGWHPVELTEEARDDSLLAGFPDRFIAFQWHYFTHGIPAGATELATSSTCTQAFRLGERAWGIQFHAEVSEEQIRSWVDEEAGDLPGGREALLAETSERISGWNELGRDLCSAFLQVAERATAAA